MCVYTMMCAYIYIYIYTRHPKGLDSWILADAPSCDPQKDRTLHDRMYVCHGRFKTCVCAWS